MSVETLAMFGITRLDEIAEPVVPAVGPASSYEDRLDKSNAPADLYNPPEIMQGFVAPFADFSSALARAAWKPEAPPAYVKKAKISEPREVDQAIACIADRQIQNSIREIVELFID